MAKLLHSVVVQDQLIGADGVQIFDLPVNPLSAVLIALRPLNDTGTLASFADYLDVCGAVNRVSVLYRGASVFSMSGRDVAALNYFRHGITPMSANEDNTNNERRCCVLPILLGRFAYDTRSCFPSSKRGELTIEVDFDIADTGYDGMRVSMEAIELIDAKPKEYERKASIARTWAATGQQDFDLPTGHRVRGLLLFGTTGFGGATPAPSWGRVELLLDSVQQGYASSDFEVAMTLGQLMGRQPPKYDDHRHIVTTDGNAQTELATLAGPYFQGSSGGWENYAFLDLDPTRDDDFSLNTRSSSNFLLRSNVETADAVRVIPIEQVSLD
jgi:hypothetical protein